MAVLMVPAIDEAYPTLGPQVCAWIGDRLVFGPGDLLGQPAVVDDETEALVWRAYEVEPQYLHGVIPGTGYKSKEPNPVAGRRRFKRVALSLRKGTAKTEKGSWITAVELHPEGPVRCDGFDARGQPVGRGVTDPYIPMVAYTEEQSDELGYAALKAILEECGMAGRDFDVGLERIMRIDGHGRAVSLATSPNARDGARTTFQWFDETHRMNLPRQVKAHQTMMLNIPKRFIADAWSLETTTAYSPGEMSVAEKTHDYAKLVASGKITDSKLFFFHRQASDGYDLENREQCTAAVVEASGPTAAWSDIKSFVDQYFDPTTDRAYWERVVLNRPLQTALQAFDLQKWRSLAIPGYRPDPGAKICSGFDGSRFEDSTGIYAIDLENMVGFLVAGWEKPIPAPKDWEVPESEVDQAVDDMFETWNVVRFYCDPPYWEANVARWAGKYGPKRVVEFRTNRWGPMAYAVRAFTTAITSEVLRNDGDADVDRHIGNARKLMLNLRDDKGERLHVIQKERSDSPLKIDFSICAILANEATNDAIADGTLNEPPAWSGIYIPKGDDA